MPAFQLFADSWGRYKIASFADATLLANFRSRWTNVIGISTSIDTDGAQGGRGLHIANASIYKTLNHSATFTGGFMYRRNGVPTGNDAIFVLMNNDKILFAIHQNTDGTLHTRAGGNNIIGVSSRALLQSRFYWIDFTVTFSGTTPIVVTSELRINTFSEITGTSTSTSINASTTLSNSAEANVIQLTATTSATFSQFYIKNSSTYYGEVDFIVIFPNGDVVTEWTPSTGTSHYVLVNTHPVDNTKYVETATVNNRDIFDWEDCPGFSGTLKAINISFLARKDDEGTKTFKIVTGDTGTEDASVEHYVSDTTEEYYEHSLETDPATGLAWTQAGFNAKRFGIKLIQ